jgi:Bacterial regulatory proteins, luxR family
MIARGLTNKEIASHLNLSEQTVKNPRQVAIATLCTRGFSSLVASTAALIATGWSEPVPGRVYPRCGPAPFTAHPIRPFYRDLACLFTSSPILSVRTAEGDRG